VVCKHCARDAAKVMAEAAERRYWNDRNNRANEQTRVAHLRRQKQTNAALRAGVAQMEKLQEATG
jgi:phage gp46-like protein